MATRNAVTTVDLEDLQSRLRDYLGRTREGESFLVTDRGEPVAELVPLSPQRQILEKLVAAGAVEWRGGKPKGLRGIVVRGEPVSETIIRDRQ